MLPALVHRSLHRASAHTVHLAAAWKQHAAYVASGSGKAAGAAATASMHNSARTLQEEEQKHKQQQKQQQQRQPQQQQQQQQQQPGHLLPAGVIVLPMPSLSHAMERGTVKRWLKQEGECCHEYDLVLEVETETLVEEAYRLDDFAGKVTLLIEANEEAWLAKQLVPEGSELPVGQPIALLCEEQDQLQQAVQQEAAVARVLDVYEQAEGTSNVRTLIWQSYLKESNKEPGSSCGCM